MKREERVLTIQSFSSVPSPFRAGTAALTKFKLSYCYYTRTRFTVLVLATWLNCRDMLNNRAIRNILIHYPHLIFLIFLCFIIALRLMKLIMLFYLIFFEIRLFNFFLKFFIDYLLSCLLNKIIKITRCNIFE